MSTTVAAMRAQSAPPPTKTSSRTLAQIMELPRERQFPAMLDTFAKEIALALPQHLTAERMSRLALTAFKQAPGLALCRPASVFQAVILSSQLGLEIGVDGQAFIIPYKDEATFIPGWKGYVELVNRAGRASVWTGAVFKGDEFDYAQGDTPFIKHKPTGEVEETEQNLTHVYAVGRVHGAQWPVLEVWPVTKVRRHRDKFNKVGTKHYSYKNFTMYGRKVSLLQVLKYMPKSVELRAAMALDRDGAGQGSFDLRDVLEGEWSNIAADATHGDPDDDQDRATDATATNNNENQATGGASPNSEADKAEAGKTEQPSRRGRGSIE